LHAVFGSVVETKHVGDPGGVDNAVDPFNQLREYPFVRQIGSRGGRSPDFDWLGSETPHNRRSDKSGSTGNQYTLYAHISL
jgi:hypothetical protein